MAKCIAGREKDHQFLSALIDEGIIAAEEIIERIDKYGIEWPDTYDLDKDLALTRARTWLATVGNS
ncbi:hypothetical protein [Rhodococcoides kyotonense]|uniref:Uncharacterized protein n=1 Tax=Rhodococcoides kyotonense TaxID=398843 RepID=A0A239ME48_9NOCA|nr:hypothetical protein [Rhodococcus kyotonensis]SNT40412.1 hypothetical protein SAMN05421642_11765 [Rhodococcus kyotonensis]